LNAAERLFGEHSYDGVGIRMLAEEARVNLNAATYHFGSKKKLYIETFMRRFRPTNVERLRLLAEKEAAAEGKPLPVEVIVECLLRPPFESGLKHHAFHRLMARNLLMPPPFIHAAIIREVQPCMEVFASALRRAMPGVPEDLIHLRSMFGMGILLMFSIHANEIPGMKKGGAHEAVLREMIQFVSSGLRCPPAVPLSQRAALPFPPRLPKP
jgi:AcrR family transcriptional regulator